MSPKRWTIAVVIKPVDQWADRRHLIFKDRGVIEGTHQRPPALELLQKAPVVDVETERLGCTVEIGAIDE
jgi:hypothetical protein